ncbi:DEAD/DEAH box helicase [Ornithinimicrobium faecis]|uniref:DEAD/DEAH box helicase n=1 Tax=Ornithinimicrobium faecis TaxID=2934158 RepID=A0ABY4YRU2_9MICO|nr:SNF2-related protein [Ornithinimicrobium sp. HY1793]USQ79098.1 DEAD/DEAH box helicase [Ornithinimicrobium sp. HY1793]
MSAPRGERVFAAPGWAVALTPPELQAIFGETTLRRGRAYQRQGVVHGLELIDGELLAEVNGTYDYETVVSWDDHGIWTDCSCPVQINCKHAAAVILEAQALAPATRRPAPVQPAQPQWEAMLAPVVAAAEQPADDTSLTPLALHLEVKSPTRYSSAHRIALRPMIIGRSGAWIKTGITWSDLQFEFTQRGHNPAHRKALTALLNAYRVRSRYWSAEDTIDAATLGPDVWRLLREAQHAGVALITGHKGKQTVELLPEPVDLGLDLTRADDGELVLRPHVDFPRSTPFEVLGNPGHGLFLRPPDELRLAELAQPLTPALTNLLATGELTIPPADADRFISRYYPALRQQVSIGSSDGSIEFPEVEPPRLALEVLFTEHHRTRLRWTFRYAVGRQIHDLPLLRGQPGDDDSVIRDPIAEEALLSSLDVLDGAPGLRVPLQGKTRLGVVLEPELQGWATVAFVSDVLPALQERDDIDITITGEPLLYEEADEAPLVAVSTQDLRQPSPQEPGDGIPDEDPGRQDWFGLGIKVSVAGQPVPLSLLLTALARHEERLLLPDGTWFSLDVPELHALRRIVEEARGLQDEPGESLRINRYQAGLWEELVSLGVVDEQSERWQRTVGDLLALEELPHPDPPAGLTATLRSYQLDGFQWLSFLWEHELGGILADDMGLGKTVQVLAAAERARELGTLSPERPMLVVAPTSVVGAWQREAERFAPELRVAALTQTVHRRGELLPETIAGAHLVLTSYALLRIDEQHLIETPWSAVVLDEAQAVKNHQSRTYRAARALRAPVKFAVTGTPLENSLMDLWSLLSIVAPGLFASPKRFGEVYRKPIETGASPELLTTLRRRVRPLMLRRTKEAVAPDLPPKIEQVLTVPLNPAHRRIYDTHLQRERQRILGLLGDVDRNRIAILSALTKLRQLSLDVHLVVPDAPAAARPSKVDALIEQLVEVAAEGHRCLVFSQFTRFLKVVRERLDEEGIGHVYLDGRTRDRPRRVAQFTDGDDPVFLISLKAGGSGLTLTEADYVFVLDPWWNPAVEAQAVDRTHRIGQDRTVMVYRLVAEDTIEEKVVELQQRKRDLFTKVVDEDGEMSAPLSADDIRGLLEA